MAVCEWLPEWSVLIAIKYAKIRIFAEHEICVQLYEAHLQPALYSLTRVFIRRSFSRSVTCNKHNEWKIVTKYCVFHQQYISNLAAFHSVLFSLFLCIIIQQQQQQHSHNTYISNAKWIFIIIIVLYCIMNQIMLNNFDSLSVCACGLYAPTAKRSCFGAMRKIKKNARIRMFTLQMLIECDWWRKPFD